LPTPRSFPGVRGPTDTPKLPGGARAYRAPVLSLGCRAGHAGGEGVGRRLRGRLLLKYVIVLVGLVGGALLTSGLVQVYFAYGENESVQLRLQEEKAAAAAATLQRFASDVVRDMTWTQQPEWVPEI